MKIYFKKIIQIILILSFSSCASYLGVPKDIKEGLTFCYRNANTEIRKLINIDGYFVIKKVIQSPVFDSGSLFNKRQYYVIDTSYRYFMFYEDGTFVSDFFDYDKERLNKGKGESDIPMFFHDIIYKKGEIEKTFYERFKWGVYKVEMDTIKVQWTTHPYFLSPYWYACEVWFKVIDRNTIIEIYSKPIHYMTESDWKNYNERDKQKVVNPATFVPLNAIPPSNSWLKSQKWFWCNESDWKKYMSNQ